MPFKRSRSKRWGGFKRSGGGYGGPGISPVSGDPVIMSIDPGICLENQDGSAITAADSSWPHSVAGDDLCSSIPNAYVSGSSDNDKFYIHDFFLYSLTKGHSDDECLVKKCSDHPTGVGTGSFEINLQNAAAYVGDIGDGYTSFELPFGRIGKYLPWVDGAQVDLEWYFKVPSLTKVGYVVFDVRLVKNDNTKSFYSSIVITTSNTLIRALISDGSLDTIKGGGSALSTDWHKIRFKFNPNNFDGTGTPTYEIFALDDVEYINSSVNFYEKVTDYGRLMKVQFGIHASEDPLNNANGIALRIAGLKMYQPRS